MKPYGKTGLSRPVFMSLRILMALTLCFSLVGTACGKKGASSSETDSAEPESILTAESSDADHTDEPVSEETESESTETAETPEPESTDPEPETEASQASEESASAEQPPVESPDEMLAWGKTYYDQALPTYWQALYSGIPGAIYGSSVQLGDVWASPVENLSYDEADYEALLEEQFFFLFYKGAEEWNNLIRQYLLYENGTVYVSMGSRGAHIYFEAAGLTEYLGSEETEYGTAHVFTATAYYSDIEQGGEQGSWTEETEFSLVETEEGWRILAYTLPN